MYILVNNIRMFTWIIIHYQTHRKCLKTGTRFSFLYENNELLIFAEIFTLKRIRSFCASNENFVKEYTTKTIKALTTRKDKTFIEYKLPRYKCKLFNKTYSHNFSNQIEKSLYQQVMFKIIDDFQK